MNIYSKLKKIKLAVALEEWTNGPCRARKKEVPGLQGKLWCKGI